MHEVCALLMLALDMEAEALHKSLISKHTEGPVGKQSGSVGTDTDLLAARWRSCVLAVHEVSPPPPPSPGRGEGQESDNGIAETDLSSVPPQEQAIQGGEGDGEGEVVYMAQEGDLYWIFDRVMRRGLQEIYKPDPAIDGSANDGIEARPHRAQYRSWEYLGHIQGVCCYVCRDD